MDKEKKWPRYYYLLLIGFGISNLGNWIYLIALNVFVWRLTQSPAAVAGIYIVGPIIRVVCGFFVGSLIDRMNKKALVVGSDIARGVFVLCMPFVDSIILIYVLIALANIASMFFGPSSMYFISTLVDDNHRLRFNSLNATLSSGAFMIGPAIGGAILAVTSISVAMWANALSFFICAFILSLIPYRKEHISQPLQQASIRTASQRIVQTIKADYQIVIDYGKKHTILRYFVIIYSIALMIAFALDSQEMTFLISVLHISEELYGLTVTIAGIGAVIGGLCATALASKFQVGTYIKVGFTLTLLSYLVFYSSPTYLISTISFVTLGFFMAFSNSGYATYYQQAVDANIMGRFSSIVNIIQSILQVIFTLLIGTLSDVFSLRFVTIIFSALGLLLSLLLWKIRNERFKHTL